MRKKTPLYSVFLDIENAYDRVVREILDKLGYKYV